MGESGGLEPDLSQPAALVHVDVQDLFAVACGSDAQAEIARRCGIPAPHLTQMKQGKRRCTPEYDLRLSCFFGITPGLWMNLQLDYEFMRAEREKGHTIRKEVRPCAA